jgi:glycosyltransferase involved in cell wall biosynthesis
MRILVISNYYPPFEIGGWEQLTNDVVQRLEHRGHAVHVLTSEHRAPELGQAEAKIDRVLRLQSPNHEHYSPLRTLFWRSDEKRNRACVARTISAFAPQVVFVNGIWNLSRGAAHQAELMCPGRVVYYVASPWPTAPDAHDAYWTAPAARAWLRLPKRCASALALKWVDYSAPRPKLDFRHVLCVSDFMRAYMVDEVGVPASRVRVVYNGVDETVFVPADRAPEAPQPPLRLLYAGGLLKDKGVHTALEALSHLVNQLHVSDVHLTLVGSGDTQYERFLASLVKGFGIAGFVTFHGRVPNDHIARLMRGFDALVFPSTGVEALPRVVQEAMACGLVVLGTTTGGTGEILRDGVNGFTFEPGDAVALAELIRRVASDVSLRARLARAARLTVIESFTMDRMAAQIEAYLRQVNEPGPRIAA